MSAKLSRPMTCARCGETIAAGARAEKTGVGNWDTCVRRGEVRHYNSPSCRPAVAPAAAVEPSHAPTSRQLAFVAELIRRDPGTAGVSYAEIARRSRAEVSAWIDLQLRLQEA